MANSGPGPAPGDVGSSAGTGAGDSDAGASGSSSGGITLSRGAIIAIIVCAVSVCILGAVSSVLWYLAKKRSWEIRASIRKSARKVVTALTPRRSTFPKDIHSKRRSSRRLSTKLDDIPGSPKEGTPDVEKGHPKMTSFVMAEPPKQPKWAKKIGR
ncbi:uncharacterized protein K444DRAFT_110889 [Hyaloscypha bicolor E]|uniref:Uncharacterized protein n=1 Tax=Hyaloscypha bicolor E TaxID=1095630 RepID=A0A2J6SV86_9HELO|nr:uncharacterized protein K444DRAFT_110889 [Hyaloscypha bicolor E]PMD54684.1 hypothetical protein K444DRAFT_110889 [Hyaloscypha bicolor E]